MVSNDLSYLEDNNAPPEVRAVAARNLFRENTIVSNFNATAGNVSAPVQIQQPAAQPTPAPAQPISQLPDLTGLQQRNKALQNALATNTDPDKPALYVNPHRKNEILAEYYHNTNLLHQATLDSTRLAHENFLQNKDITSSQQLGNFTREAAGITDDIGSDTYRDKLIGLAGKYKKGLSNQIGLATFNALVQEHRHAKALGHTQDALTPPEVPGMHVTLEHIGPNGRPSWNYKPIVDAEKRDKELIQAYGVPQKVIQNATGVQVGDITGDKWVGNNAGNTVRFSSPTGKKDVQMSKSEYLAHGGKLALESMGAPDGSKTEVITKDGHHYEVDHANKKVLRQID